MFIALETKTISKKMVQQRKNIFLEIFFWPDAVCLPEDRLEAEGCLQLVSGLRGLVVLLKQSDHGLAVARVVILHRQAIHVGT